MCLFPVPSRTYRQTGDTEHRPGRRLQRRLVASIAALVTLVTGGTALAAAPAKGIWASGPQIQALPTSGPGLDAVLSRANVAWRAISLAR